ncbi:MAG: hypothetical protein ACYC9L_08285 [Sulfuricaulis sp.]
MRTQARNHRCIRGLLLKALPTAMLLALGGNACAATLTVNSLADNTIAGDGLVTLREAMLASINRTATDLGQTGTGNDTIDLTGVSGTIALNAVLPSITDLITITGPGAAMLTIQGSSGHGAGDDGIFFVSDVLVMSKVTLAGGTSQGGAGTTVQRDGAGGGASGMGGAVFVNAGGKFTADYVTFTGNRAIGGSGGSTNGPSGTFYAGGGGGFGEDAPAMVNSPAYGVEATRGGNGGPFGNTGGRAGTVGNTGYAGNGGDGGGGGGGGTGIATRGGNGGFAGGGGGAGWAYCGAGPSGAGGYGGGGGGGTVCNSSGYVKAVGGAGGSFGGKGGDGSATVSQNSGTGGGGGGGGGLGGALFVRTGGEASLSNCTFNSNQAQRGLGGSGGSNGLAGSNGQGKGGAIFVMSGATVLVHNLVTVGDSATDAGGTSTDNADIYGIVDADTIFRDGFDGGGL